MALTAFKVCVAKCINKNLGLMSDMHQYTQKDLDRVRSLALKAVQSIESGITDNILPRVTQQDIDSTIFLIAEDNEIRLSGEDSNTFSSMYMDYYNPSMHSKFIEAFNKVSKGKWMLEWYCAGYQIAYRQY